MKRYLFLITAILCCQMAWGQKGNYEIIFYITNIDLHAPISNNCGSFIHTKLHFTNNQEEEYFYQPVGDNENLPRTWKTTFSADKKLQSLWVDVAAMKWHGGFSPGCDRDNGFTGYVPISYGYQSCLSDQLFSDNFGFTGYRSVLPQLTINNTGLEDALPVEDDIIISSHTDFKYEEYNWEYSLDGVSWIYLSQYNGQSSIQVDAEDILGNNSSNYIGEKIYFRQVAYNYKAISNIVIYTVIKSAPHIVSNTVTPNQCSYGETGSVTLNFDRVLLEGETLRIGLQNLTTGSGVSNIDLTEILKTATAYTINGLLPGNYKLNLNGKYNDNNTYTGAESHQLEFSITAPPPVTFNAEKTSDVLCYGDSTGEIKIGAGGGTGNNYQYSLDGGLNWIDFNNGNQTTVENLSKETYKIKVRDGNGCIAKESGSDKEITIEIYQPNLPLQFVETNVSQPTGYGLSNGYISVIVKGGTPNFGPYSYQWTNMDSNTIITQNITTQNYSDGYGIKLDQIPAGNYHLLITDTNNCTLEQDFEVGQPAPLVVEISVQKIISCNINNEDVYKSALDNNGNGIFDKAEDGILKAAAQGGVGAYSYQWQIKNGGNFENISGATSSILSNLTAATYKILIKDVNNNQTEAEFTLGFPPVLTLSLSGSTLDCSNMSNGTVSATPNGGISPYSYQWNNGQTTQGLTNLSAGNYFVMVQDANVCTVKGNVSVNQPDGVEINDILVKNPTCYGGADGEIKIETLGGNTPYAIQWSNGMSGNSVSGLSSGTYIVTFTDSKGCSASKEYVLTDPEPLIVDLGKDIVTLCTGDIQTYDVKISDPQATYQWTDKNGNVIGINSAITLSQAGVYAVLVTDSKGCTGTDQVEIKNSLEVLSPEFMLTTHAYIDYDVVLVNTSPTPPESVEWILPETNAIQIIEESSEYLKLKFLQTGSYHIGLKGKQGECEKIFYKDVIVEENTIGVEIPQETASNIEEFTIVPNPNNGTYKIIVKLYEEAQIKLRIMDLVSHEPFAPVNKPKAKAFDVPFQNIGIPSGTYLIILETGNEARVKKMIVN